MSDCCKWCNGDAVQSDWPPETDDELCLDCHYRWFEATVVALVRDMESHNCYEGEGILCTCTISEYLYSRLLDLCGVKVEKFK